MRLTRDYRLIPTVWVIVVLIQAHVLLVLLRLLLVLTLSTWFLLCARGAGQATVRTTLWRGADLFPVKTTREKKTIPFNHSLKMNLVSHNLTLQKRMASATLLNQP